MQPSTAHTHKPDVSFDGGDLDCGNGLLLLIRKHIDPMPKGQFLEIRSTEISVDEDLPAWCRMTRNELVSWTKSDKQRSFLVCKGMIADRGQVPAEPVASAHRHTHAPAQVVRAKRSALAAPKIQPLSVMGIGSWPRPRWMINAMHEHMTG